MKKIVKWTPRVLSVLFVIFTSLFAFDVFSEGYSFGQSLVVLLIHLIPSFIFAGFAVLAWKWPKVGGIGYILLAIITIFAFNTGEYIVNFLTITGIPFLVGILFLLDAKS